MSLSVRDRLRAGHVSRWHIVNAVREQSLAEHSFNVAIIAMELAERLGFEQWSDRVAVVALLHDIDEVVEGDIPASAKPRKEWEPGKWTPEKIVKVADVMEAYVWITENGLGGNGMYAVDFMSKAYADVINGQNDWAKDVIQRLLDDIKFGEFYEQRRARILAERSAMGNQAGR